MALSSAAILDQIEQAITALLTGGASSYSIGSRTVTKLDLSQLMQERRMLQIQVQREAGSGAFSLAKMGKRSR